MENLDNKDYRIFPINAAKVLSNKEAYIYLALLFKSDFQTGESNVFLTSSMRHPKQKSHLDGSKSDLIARCFSLRKSVFVK